MQRTCSVGPTRLRVGFTAVVFAAAGFVILTLPLGLLFGWLGKRLR